MLDERDDDGKGSGAHTKSTVKIRYEIRATNVRQLCHHHPLSVLPCPVAVALNHDYDDE